MQQKSLTADAASAKAKRSTTKGRPMPNECAECQAGEHDDYSPGAKLVTIRNPGTNHIINIKLCDDHIRWRLNDGYQVYHKLAPWNLNKNT